MMEITNQVGNLWHKEATRKKRLNEGVNCAHVCIPSQCEWCRVQNLEGRYLLLSNNFYVKCIHQANLNAMAGKSHLTISRHCREIMGNIKHNKLVGKTSSYQPCGLFPEEDQVGMGVLVDMLLKSLIAKGRI